MKYFPGMEDSKRSDTAAGNYYKPIKKNITMRTYFAQVKTRYQAIRECPFTPSNVAKVYGGFICFESTNDYNTWKNQK